MGLDMYLERMPRYGSITAKEINDIQSYFDWKDDKKNPESKARNFTLKEWCGINFKELPSKQVRDFYEQFYTPKCWYWDIDHKYAHKMICEEVGYWRKANHIHLWFVNNIQDGEDDCCYHREIKKEDIEKLLNTCHEVLDGSILVDGKINNGWTIKNGEEIPIVEDGRYILNTEVAEKLLPTTSGFFFGSVDYDEWYIESIENTIEICECVLETTDFDKQMIYYISSW